MQQKNTIMTFIKVIGLVIVLIVAFLLGSYIWVLSPKVYEPPILSYDFYKSERYLNSDPFILFSKYYYYEDLGEIWNDEYILIDDNVEMIKNYIRVSLNKLHEFDNSIDVEFNYDIIQSSDYYFLETIEEESLVILHYYDVDEHILYTTYFPELYVDKINS